MNSNTLLRTFETDSVSVLTDDVLYMTYAETHTYTFTLINENPQYYIENLVLHYNVDTELYDEYLVQYDITGEEYLAISEGEDISESAQILISELENGTLSGLMNRSNCYRTCTTICVPCTTKNVHHVCGDAECSYVPGDADAAYTYQSCSSICLDVPEDETIDDGDSSGGGNGDVNTRPKPTEPCSESGDIGIMGSDGCTEVKDGEIQDGNQLAIDQKNCDELNNLTIPKDPNNHHPSIGGENKNIRNALLGISNEIVSGFENGYVLKNTGNFLSPPDGHGPFAENIESGPNNKLNPKKNGFMFGIIHTHPYNDPNNTTFYNVPMFSADDLTTLSTIKHNYSTNLLQTGGDDESLFVVFLSVKIGTTVHTYALKIDNLVKFQALDAIRNNSKDFDIFDKDLENIYEKMEQLSNPDLSAGAYEEAFLKFITNHNGEGYDLGIGMFKMETNNVNNPQGGNTTEINWKKLKLSEDGNSVESTDPCN